MNKKALCLFILFFSSSVLFAIPQKRLEFTIKNSTSSNVIVNMEFWYGPGSAPPDPQYPNLIWADGTWPQTISDISLSIRGQRTNIVIPSGRHISIVQYSAGGQFFDRMISLPFVDMINATFKRLDLIYNDGLRIITLDDLGKINWEKITIWESWFYEYLFEIVD